MQWVDDFLDAVVKGFAGMDFGIKFKPIDCFEIFPLYAKEGVDRILNILENAKNQDMKELASKIHSPSVLRIEMFLVLIKAKLANVDEEKLVQIAEFYNSLLRTLCLEDYYAKDGKNIIHTKKEIKQFIDNLKVADPKIAEELGRLSNSCYHLAYGLYSDNNPQICYENFGPYDVSDEFGEGHILVIKQFQNLKPIELWGSKIEDLPYDKIRVYCVYKDLIFFMDAASHANFEGDLISGLKHFAVEIDGRVIGDLSEVRQATEKIGLKAMEMWSHLTGLDFETAKKKYLEQRCYNYVSLCKVLGIDWRPTKEMLEAVKDKQLAKGYWPEFSVPESETAFWRLLIDPRVGNEKLKQYFGASGNRTNS